MDTTPNELPTGGARVIPMTASVDAPTPTGATDLDNLFIAELQRQLAQTEALLQHREQQLKLYEDAAIARVDKESTVEYLLRALADPHARGEQGEQDALRKKLHETLLSL